MQTINRTVHVISSAANFVRHLSPSNRNALRLILRELSGSEALLWALEQMLLDCEVFIVQAEKLVIEHMDGFES